MSNKQKRSAGAGNGGTEPNFSPIKTPSRLKIVEKSEAMKADFVICSRVSNAAPSTMFVPNKRIEKCSRCGERVYLSPGSPRGITPLCLECFDAQPVEEDTQMIVTNESIVEAARAIAEDILLSAPPGIGFQSAPPGIGVVSPSTGKRILPN